MKRIIEAMVIAVLLTAGLYGQGGEYYYYDVDGSHINLQVLDNLVSVRLDPNAGGIDAESFAISQPALLDTFSFQESQGGFVTYGIGPGYNLEQALASLRLDTKVLMANPVAVTSLGDRRTLGNRLVVIYKTSTSQAQIEALQQSFGLQVSEVIGDSLPQIYLLDYGGQSQSDITKMARDYFNTGLCLTVEPNIVSKCYGWSNDPYYGEQWQPKNTGQNGGTVGADIDWEPAREYHLPNFTKPIVALIDMGFQMNHEDLRPNWYTWPYDAAGPDRIQHPELFDYDPSNECGDTLPQCWHGTGVLGVLSAYVDNGTGLAGVADSARIMPIKIADAKGNFDQTSISRGLDWARQNHGGARAQVVCMTVGFPDLQSPAIDQKLYSMYKSGKPIIASAGNHFVVHYPASSPYVLAVGMTDNNDDRGVASGYGPALDVVAPGYGVWTFDLMGNEGLNPAYPALACDANQNYVCRMTGTSYAAPVVAGVAAKLLERDPWLMGSHYMDSAEVMYDILRKSCERQQYGVANDDYRRVNDEVGWGRVNAARAIVAACKSCGDANDDGNIDIADAVFLITYIFKSGNPPRDCQYEVGMGDANGDGAVDIADAVYLITYIFKHGNAPHCQAG